ncbi:ABC transporter permease [Deltaproteobacteria bacterium TL4]
MFLVLLKGSLTGSVKKKLLAFLTIFLAASLITALMNLSLNVGDKMSHEMKSYGANLSIVPKSESLPLEIEGTDYNPLSGEFFLEEQNLSAIKNIFWRNNIIGFAPFLKISAKDATTNGDAFMLMGTYFQQGIPLFDEPQFRTGVISVYPYWQVQGAWPQDEQAEVLVGKTLAEVKRWKAGDSVIIRSSLQQQEQKVTIRGILETGGVEDHSMVAPLALVQQLGNLPGKLHTVGVSALTVPENTLSRRAYHDPDTLNTSEYDHWFCSAYVSTIARQLEDIWPGSSVRPIWQVAEGEGRVISKIQLLMAIVTLASFVASALGIASLMSATILERSREIGLMKALGAASWEIHGLFLMEAGTIGVAGGILGWVAGILLSQGIAWNLFNSEVSVGWVLLPLILLISVLITLAGAWVPSRWITRLHPAEVLHGH